MKTYINMRDSHKSHANRTLKILGDRLEASECRRALPTPLDADLLIQWGYKPTPSLLSQISRGKPYVIVDLGYFDERTARFSISFNGFHGTSMLDEFVYDREPRFTPPVDDYNLDGEKVIICGQMPGDRSLRGQDIDAWMGRTAAEAAEVFKRPVIKRPHPKMLNPWEPQIEPLYSALEDCHVCITWTSTAGVQSVLRGVPTVAMHPGSMAYPVAAHNLSRRAPPGREGWLHSLSYREWDWRSPKDLDRLAEYIIELYPQLKKAPVDSPRNRL